MAIKGILPADSQLNNLNTDLPGAYVKVSAIDIHVTVETDKDGNNLSTVNAYCHIFANQESRENAGVPIGALNVSVPTPNLMIEPMDSQKIFGLAYLTLKEVSDLKGFTNHPEQAETPTGMPE